jgi:glycosyltransferase involved in cell wall biosynthesis
MDVLTLPSVREGHPVTLIEGQMAGLPIVASNIPSAYEAVAPAFHDYLRSPHDATGLAEAFLSLADRVRREPALRSRAREFGRKFTVENSRLQMLAAWKVPGVVAPPDPCGWAGPHPAEHARSTG